MKTARKLLIHVQDQTMTATLENNSSVDALCRWLQEGPVTVEMEDLDQSAVTQQEIAQRLEELIDLRWRERDIGSQLRAAQVWQTVRDTPNVRLVRSILLEGRYDEAGVQRVVPLEDDGAFPYATVKSGSHFIQIV